VIRHLVVRIRLVECGALQGLEVRDVFAGGALSGFLLVALSSGFTPSFFTSAEACRLTAVWSVIMSWANSDTCLFLVRDLASLPASMSIWSAATHDSGDLRIGRSAFVLRGGVDEEERGCQGDCDFR